MLTTVPITFRARNEVFSHARTAFLATNPTTGRSGTSPNVAVMSKPLRDAERAAEPRPRLVTRPLALVFAVTVTSLTGVFLLLSVVPMYAVDGGAGRSGALATGALMLTTVLAELALPGCSPGSGTGRSSRSAPCCWPCRRSRWRSRPARR